MKLSDCIADYLNHIRHERGLAKSTCLHYQCWLRHFTDWLTESGYPAADLDTSFTVPVLRRYQYAKAKSGTRPRTVHSAFHSVRGLGEFLLANGLIETNPVKLLTLPKKDAAIRMTVTDEQVRSLFDACDRLPRARQVALSRDVLAVLCYGALRRAEVCDLRVIDIDLTDLRNGANLRDVQAFLGHADLQTTAQYLHSDQQQLRKISELTALRPNDPTPATATLPAKRFSIRRLSR